MKHPLQQTNPGATLVLATLNARYIHASLGLRYLLANLDRHGGTGLRAQAVLREYTIARAASDIVAELLATLGPPDEGKPQIVGFGVYIWNVTQTTEVLRLLKAARPGVKVILGGPEVSHETDAQAIIQLADHVITGWGDVSFAKLCRSLLDGPRPLMKVIAGEQPALDQIELPYAEYRDADLANRILYVEASRGCPFKCEFCLSALDKTAWAFEPERVLAALDNLYRRGARQFKFVDRTFNLKVEQSVCILQFFLDRLPAAGAPTAADDALFLHFEVIPDRLPERLRAMLARFPPGALQLEVGVQTFNEAVQQTISRKQDNAATEANLRWLLAHSHAHLHVDLIFGLPGESLDSFADGFDRLLALKPHEIQLGVLKRLRGAPVARHSAAHGMVFDAAPPYAVQQTALLDEAAFIRFARLARYWDLLANSGRFAQTLALLWRAEGGDGLGAASPFRRFLALSDALWLRLGTTTGVTPEQLVDALFDCLTQPGLLGADAVRQALLADYVASGARASPATLRGVLPRYSPTPARAFHGRAVRQNRHGAVTPAASGHAS